MHIGKSIIINILIDSGLTICQRILIFNLSECLIISPNH